MKRGFIAVTIVLAVATAACVITYLAAPSGLMLTLAITLGTTLYHFAVRLLVGYAFGSRRYNCESRWFCERKFERRLFKVLRVRRWKRLVPTFLPDKFDLSKCTAEQIMNACCGAEVVHELCAVLSFLPLLLIIPFGTEDVFISTSSAGALLDLVFVTVQRYNRPRLAAMIKIQNKRRV